MQPYTTAMDNSQQPTTEEFDGHWQRTTANVFRQRSAFVPLN